MKRIRHDNDLAKAIASAAKMKSVAYLKRTAIRLARKLELELPTTP